MPGMFNADSMLWALICLKTWSLIEFRITTMHCNFLDEGMKSSQSHHYTVCANVFSACSLSALVTEWMPLNWPWLELFKQL